MKRVISCQFVPHMELTASRNIEKGCIADTKYVR